MSDSRIAEESAEGSYRLDDGARAVPAVSCLVRPRRGDGVLTAVGASGDVYILAILERPGVQPAEIGVPGAPALTLAAPRVALHAAETIQVQSLRDVEVTAVGGNLSLNARNVLTTAAEAVIENMRHYFARAGAFAVQVQTLLRLHSQQAVVTAEGDIKVDAERISLG